MSDRSIQWRIEDARPNFKPVVRNASGQVGTRSYNYADLNTVVDAVELALGQQGVGIRNEVNAQCVVTRLVALDDPSSFVTSAVPLPEGLTPQQTGSAITYFRRYNLVALLNLQTESDDDGSAASSPVTTREVAPEAQADAAPVETPVPDGWDSREQAIAAHQRLAERIAALPVGTIDTAAFRATHSFPYSTTDYTVLEEVVRTTESLLA